jgi:aldehyde dehydrogenase (NAD+)
MIQTSTNLIASELRALGIEAHNSGTCTGIQFMPSSGDMIESYSPVDGQLIGSVSTTSKEQYEQVVQQASKAFLHWRNSPAPRRGEIIRQYGNVLRENKEALGKLVSYEMGKSYQEGLGEVQEMIDICDFAVGLSRQLYGNTMASERPLHRMYEQWHPLGIVGIISAFNFPVAVWSWNAMLAAICGDVCIWKPSEKAPISAVACHKLLAEVLKANDLPEGIFNLVNGDYKVGEWMSRDERIPLISATGSTAMGRKVGVAVAERFGKSLLELGGNNAIIISEHANLEMALIAVLFGAVGTAGQRCTTTRRLIIHKSVYESMKGKLLSAYKQLSIGNPLEPSNLVGPLIDKAAVGSFSKAIERVKELGGKVLYGGDVLEGPSYESGCYVVPALVEASNDFDIVQKETFAPILYLMQYNTIEEAIAMQNGVRQGLSSSIFSNHIRETELFLSYAGSDCGIANVNIGTSGAEIGGAFGGEKETGGGRESGSDSWKAYMRRQTNTINYGTSLPLAQGIRFDV